MMAGKSTSEDRVRYDAIEDVSFGDLLVLPVQFTTPFQRKLNGIRHLMAAVLTDGVEAFCRNAGGTTTRSRRLYQEAADWIFSDDRSYAFSFLNLCDALEIDPDFVRERLRPGEGAPARLGALARVLPRL